MNVSALRALARVELRQLRRHPARSILVLLLIAVPVAAVVGGGALYRVTQPTLAERRAARLGAADLRVELDSRATGEEAERALIEALPAGARTARLLVEIEQVHVPGRRLDARSFTLDPEGLTAGMWVFLAGRAPVDDGEVALSRMLLDGLEVAVGDAVTLRDGLERIVSGIATDPENLDLPLVLRSPEAGASGPARALLVDARNADPAALAALLRDAGWTVTTRADVTDGDGFESMVVFVVGGFAFFEAALVISAAFAVGLRRRQRELGLLGATGAEYSDVRNALVASSLVLAGLGGLLGVGVGLAGAAGLGPFLDGWNGRLNGPFEVSPVHVLGALALGLLTAGLAAALPARAAARLPLRIALAGRRPVAAPASRWLVIGTVLLGAGTAAMLVATGAGRGSLSGVVLIVGSAVAALGLCAAAPWILERLARLASPLPVAWRLAVRDSGRFRARNGPVVAAVLAGMSVSVLVAALVASLEHALPTFLPNLRDDQLLIEGAGAEEVARELAAELSCAAHASLFSLRTGSEFVLARLREGERPAWVACGDEELLRALGAEAGREAFRAGRLVVLGAPGEELDKDGVELELRAASGKRLEAPDFTFVTSGQGVREPRYLMSAAVLGERGFRAGPPPRHDLVPHLLRLDAPVTEETVARARARAAEVPGTSVDAALLRARPSRIFFSILLGVSLATGLVVILIATALSSAEGAADARVLHTVGAAPRLLRRHLAARAGYLALLGCVLAVPAGLLPAYGIQRLSSFTLTFTMPWGELLLSVVGLPLLAFAATWTFSARRGSARAWRRALS